MRDSERLERSHRTDSYPAEFGHAVLKRATEFGPMGPHQALHDALLGLGKRGKDIGGRRAPVAVVSLPPRVLLLPHLPSGLLCLVCGLALPQGQKAREILFGATERLDIEIGFWPRPEHNPEKAGTSSKPRAAKTSLAVSAPFGGTKAIESAGWPVRFSVKR